MTRQQVYRLPTPGEWHHALDDIVPGAHPNRPPQPPTGTTSRAPRRKVAVARRSRERLAPDGNYFFWCDNCDYCNTASEGQQARCADHQRAHETARKALQRRGGNQRTDAGEYVISGATLTRILDTAAALALADSALQRARYRGNPDAAQRVVDQAVKDLLSAVRGLPPVGWDPR